MTEDPYLASLLALLRSNKLRKRKTSRAYRAVFKPVATLLTWRLPAEIKKGDRVHHPITLEYLGAATYNACDAGTQGAPCWKVLLDGGCIGRYFPKPHTPVFPAPRKPAKKNNFR